MGQADICQPAQCERLFGHVHSEFGNSLDEPARPPACYPIVELSEIDVVVALARRALEKTATTDTAQHPYGAVLTLSSASVPVFVSSQRQTGPVWREFDEGDGVKNRCWCGRRVRSDKS
jgi:hypothetical protein